MPRITVGILIALVAAVLFYQFGAPRDTASEAEVTAAQPVSSNAVTIASTDSEEPPVTTTLADPAATTGLNDFAWHTFIRLMPIQSGVIFENFRATSTVLLPDGSRPPAWGEAVPLPEAVVEYAASHNIPADARWHNLDTVVQVDGLALQDKWLQNVRYELLMNQAIVDYLIASGLYNANGLAAHNGPLNFPADSTELKTSWIWIDSADTSNKLAELEPYYYIGNAYFEDANGQLQIGSAALTGVHIVPKDDTANWVWITFENEHNDVFTNVKYQLQRSTEVLDSNSRYQQSPPLTGSVFSNYLLNGVQTEFDTNGAPGLLANSQIESNFQQSSSCITCHSLAKFKADPLLSFFNIVDTAGNGTSYFTGEPPATDGWTSMDFAWSLRRASWQRQ